MLATVSLFRLVILGVGHLWAPTSAAGDDNGLLWSSTGGGWRSMAANSAYAQVFARIGLFETADAPHLASFDAISTTSGSSWFSAQFFFSEQYYSNVVDGTPESLGAFTQKWLEAYASTQVNVTNSCGPLQKICDAAGQLPAGNSISDIVGLLPLMVYFNFSWPNLVYAMFSSCSESYGDPNFVNTEATSANKLAQLKGTDLYFHTSLLPNMRARTTDTITYLSKDNNARNSSYTVPLPRDWSVRDRLGDGWYAGVDSVEFPGGLVFPAPTEFVDSTAYANFPVYPPKSSDGIFTTPDGNMSGEVKPDDMAPPFGGTPTAVQISTASSSTLGYMSEELPSYFAQFFSLQSFGVEEEQELNDSEKAALLLALDTIQNELWETGLMANIATCSAWTEQDPTDMPECEENNVWFTDGGYTDGPSAALTISQYQDASGIDGNIKIIISNNNEVSNNMNNILQYFNTSWNVGVPPGDFIWAPGVGSGPQTNPWQSQQVFEEYLDEDSIQAALEPIEGTNVTMAVINATTVDNPAYGIRAGQNVSIALLNINSDIPTFLVTEPVIQAYTPAVVNLVEMIAGSQDLEDRLRAFIGVSDVGQGRSPSLAHEDGSTSRALASWCAIWPLAFLATVGLVTAQMF